jgi:hypothetical protein
LLIVATCGRVAGRIGFHALVVLGRWQGDCGQSNWQAQTAPVINKRLGPEVLEQYDAEHPEPDQGCQ